MWGPTQNLGPIGSAVYWIQKNRYLDNFWFQFSSRLLNNCKKKGFFPGPFFQSPRFKTSALAVIT